MQLWVDSGAEFVVEQRGNGNDLYFESTTPGKTANLSQMGDNNTMVVRDPARQFSHINSSQAGNNNIAHVNR